jgi:hypothetical protein
MTNNATAMTVAAPVIAIALVLAINVNLIERWPRWRPVEREMEL